jgi:hypothetical protein
MNTEKEETINKLIALATDKLITSGVNEIEIRDEEWQISVRVTKMAPYINSMYPSITSWQFTVPS